ncbi:hypothetical protein Tsubulata_027783 [Turnera subulata]|uniref:BHLH domain-containing protein n=1 Tax=Turnera subulata TaxID=218843 RepID=A0A9Q0G1Y5_9ROSI|nr:hypothetical protein Tsubulata_027783 [Turnera subulata]
MADLYGTAPSPAAPEPEEISSFLHHLLHNSSASPPLKFMHHALSSSLNHPPPSQLADSEPEPLDRHRLSEGVNFSDPGGYYQKEGAENAASSGGGVKRRGVSVETSNNDLGDFSCDSDKGGELPTTTVRPRSSSKRSRAAEVHNLSEKRRRSRINEKMKALQNLIPNSNKTDKASMLDEAIEYLKQLQLQVQMLTMRNGLSLHPMCLPGVLQPMQMPLEGVSFGEATELFNMNTVTGTCSANEENSAQTALNLPSQCAMPNQPIVMHVGPNMTNSETALGFGPLIQVHHAPFNLSSSPKDVCREGTSQTQLDANQTVKASSSGVS